MRTLVGPSSLPVWSLRLAAVAPVAVALGCTSLSGLSGGEDAGAPEGGLILDAGLPDVTRRDAGADARRDARDASLLDARDAAHAEARAPVDAGKEAESDAPHDAGADVFMGDCGAYEPPDAGTPPACAPIDGNSCIPSVPDFHPTYHPPTPRSTACSVEEVNEFVAECFGPSSSGAACSSFSTGAPGCYACLITNDQTNAELGPIVYEGAIGSFDTNQAGCVALVDPCETECARVFDAERECFEQACSNCQVAGPDWYQCQKEAQGCSCGPIMAQANACTAALQNDPVEEPCFVGDKFPEIAQSYGVYFCAGGDLVRDAGSDGG